MPTSGYAAAYEAIRAAYMRYVGRPPESASVVDQWLGGDYSQESIDRAIGGIQREPEAVAYQQSQANQPAPATTAPPANTPFTPTAGARYDQWSGSGNVTTNGSNFGNVEGFDANNWNDPNMQTAKYQAGRIFGRFDPNDPNVGASILNDPEFKRLFPNARLIGPDKIDFGDGMPVDFIRGHGAPGAKFAWQADPRVTSASQGTGTVRPGTVSTTPATTPMPTPTAPPPTDVPMYSLPDPTAPPPAADAARAGDAAMSSIVPQAATAQAPVMAPDDVMMSELAQQRAARLRGMRWNPQAVI